MNATGVSTVRRLALGVMLLLWVGGTASAGPIWSRGSYIYGPPSARGGGQPLYNYKTGYRGPRYSLPQLYYMRQQFIPLGRTPNWRNPIYYGAALPTQLYTLRGPQRGYSTAYLPPNHHRIRAQVVPLRPGEANPLQNPGGYERATSSYRYGRTK